MTIRFNPLPAPGDFVWCHFPEKVGNPGPKSRPALVIAVFDNDQLIYCDETITPLTDENDTITHYVSIFRGLTTRVLEEQMFREMVRFDGLTGALTREDYLKCHRVMAEEIERLQMQKSIDPDVVRVQYELEC